MDRRQCTGNTSSEIRASKSRDPRAGIKVCICVPLPASLVVSDIMDDEGNSRMPPHIPLYSPNACFLFIKIFFFHSMLHRDNNVSLRVPSTSSLTRIVSLCSLQASDGYGEFSFISTFARREIVGDDSRASDTESIDGWIDEVQE